VHLQHKGCAATDISPGIAALQAENFMFKTMASLHTRSTFLHGFAVRRSVLYFLDSTSRLSYPPAFFTSETFSFSEMHYALVICSSRSRNDEA
jgi:hypothetical protein